MKQKKNSEKVSNPAAASTGAPKFDQVESGVEKWKNPYFYIMLAAFVLFGILLFDAKLFLMGDDADYILDAYNFIHSGTYPVGRSSLYAMVLALPVAIVGTNVVALKCFSFLCAIIGFVTLYGAFYKRIPHRILYAVLIFSIVNSSIQYYSSSNLSEAFYMMVQYFYLAAAFSLIQKLEKQEAKGIQSWLLIGFMGLVISLSKNIAIVVPLSLSIFFLLRKEWRNAGMAFIAFLIFKLPYELLLRMVYKQNTVVGQLDQVLAKDLYHHEKGREDFGGFINRLIENTQIYFSDHTITELGIKTSPGVYAITAILFIGLILYGLIVAFKRNHFVLLTGTYVTILCGGTFLALQPAVQQGRIIHILIPLLLLLLLYALEKVLSRVAGGNEMLPKIGTTVLAALIVLSNLTTTSEKIQEKLPTFTENISGDAYYGYTTDWINYLEMGKWVANNISPDSLVAARKPNSLTVYSYGRPFYGIYNSEGGMNANQLLDKLEKEKVRYLILASLRLNPDQYIPNQFIGTLHSWAARIEQAYPGTMQIVHQVGTLEPCMLVKINFPRERKELPPVVIQK
jgi:hypothetical protein